ncbi:MAG TPA: dihydropteroate synthase [Candidatus Krumholzibacteria bacterium]|nr:dihydropteroate synthase [Candidatus Krumholzibacteria bacterium]
MSSTQPRPALRCGDRTLAFRRTPLVMGILNVTPDSFSDGGQFTSRDAAVAHAHAMAAAGADVIDAGGESTRPGANAISPQEEIDRVVPVIEMLVHGGDRRPRLPIPVSVDTRNPLVARAALGAGATMLNDVNATRDSAMVDVLRDHPHVPVVLMHMLGEPRTMQDDPHYDDAPVEVADYLALRAAALEAGGIDRSRILLDPGIGFGKRVFDNLAILKSIDALRALGYPVLVGASRKSFLGKLLGGAAPEDRLPGSLAVAALCHQRGVEMLRVHDVPATVGFLRVLDAIDHPDDHRPGR